MICKRCEKWITYNARSKFIEDYCRHCSVVVWGEHIDGR